MIFISLLGSPGSGKSTIGARLAAHLPNTVHISVGSLLRAKAADPSYKFSDTISSYLATNELLPTSIMNEILQLRLVTLDPSIKVVLFDGFPRSLENSRGFSSIKWKCEPRDNKTGWSTEWVIYFHCSHHSAKERFMARIDGTRPMSDEKVFDKRHAEFLLNSTQMFDDNYNDRDGDRTIRFLNIDAGQEQEEVWAQLLTKLETWKEWLPELNSSQANATSDRKSSEVADLSVRDSLTQHQLGLHLLTRLYDS